MRHISVIVFCVALVLGLAGCKGEEQKQPAQQAMPAPYVSVFDVVARDMPWPTECQAVAAGSRAVEVRSRVQGIIQKRLYSEGDYVREGQVLFELEREQYEAVYQQALASFNNADREWKRVRPLYAANAVSQKERDNALSNFDLAKAALRQAKVNLDYCQVVSPVSGFSSKEALSEGNLVSNSSLLTTVNQTDPMYIEFSIPAPERMLRQSLQRRGLLSFPENDRYRARLRLLDGRMYEQEGTVDFIDRQVVPTTGSIRARASFPNGSLVVMPGQYVRLFMDGDILHNAVFIPQQSVMITSVGTFVMVVGEKNVVRRVKVELGPFIGNSYLVYEGLKGGERIVSDGLLKTRDGMPVRYDDPKAAKAPAAAK